MYAVFWWCSAMARMDTRDAMDGVNELVLRGGSLRMARAIPPEEVTTFNLVRRLASSLPRIGCKVAAALHSRYLEGTGAPPTVPPSGADLQLAVEVRDREWVHLILQAKRMFPSGAYESWKVHQIDDLRRWASRVGGVPGMLLYNAPIVPFGPPRTWVDLGDCCRMQVRCHGWRWPQWVLPDDRSPLAITLLPLPYDGSALPADLNVGSVSAHIAAARSRPFECIFCPTHPLPTGPAPRWAEELLAIGGADVRAGDVVELPADLADELEAKFFLAIAMPDEEP